ncbi:MAG TPA: alpha/beta hydrolase [Candidatus Binatia bacterium]
MIVIVHGYDGSGPGHWQRWLHDELRARGDHVVFPELPAPCAPCKDAWVDALAAVVAAAQAPPTFICHSLGCWALDHFLAARPATPIHAALLVAPPSPLIPFEPVESFMPPPRRRDAWAPIAARTLLVGSDDDDYASPEDIAEIADALGVPHRILAGAGHINVASGYGPWPFALEWLDSVRSTAASRA